MGGIFYLKSEGSLGLVFFLIVQTNLTFLKNTIDLEIFRKSKIRREKNKKLTLHLLFHG